MNMTKKISAVVIALALLAGTFFIPGNAWAADNVVKVAKKGGVGRYLTDFKGMTLYVYTKDSEGKSACLGECLVKWPIYYQEKVAARSGLNARSFGNFTRIDGKKQTTYKGMPLYYSSEDKVAGDTNGQGIEDTWFIVAP